MSHIDPEQLALIALGERPDEAELEHLASCVECSGDVAALAEAVRAGRAPVDLEAPDDVVWQRIRADLGWADAAPRADTAPRADAAPREVVALPREVVALPRELVAVPTPQSDDRPVRSRATRWWVTGVAAAATIGLVVSLVGGLWWQAAPSDSGTVVARAELSALPAWTGASGQADVEDLADGSRELVLHVEAPAVANAYREVWLLAPDASRLVSLGVLAGSDGRFSLPSDLDLNAYPLVDVSAEPDDGDPQHSGDSIVRGALSGSVS
ncbi:anti-sigma factor [Microbacteriaceae bacterium VKM Ac-2855]|nr:anti-sigma factor [Microbacteriaceae bacterium VKM Ac-2855]